MLWGKKQKEELDKHIMASSKTGKPNLKLEDDHPNAASRVSRRSCDHYWKAMEHRKNQKKPPIDWSLFEEEGEQGGQVGQEEQGGQVGQVGQEEQGGQGEQGGQVGQVEGGLANLRIEEDKENREVKEREN